MVTYMAYIHRVLRKLLIRYQVLISFIQRFIEFNGFGHETLTHCGRVTQIGVYALQLWKTDDAHLRF